MNLEEKKKASTVSEGTEDRKGPTDPDNDQEDARGEEAPVRPGSLRGGAYVLGGRKWALICFLGCMIAVSGVWGFGHGREWMEWSKKEVPEIGLKGKAGDNLWEEKLSPFFIPLPPNGSCRALVIDLSVIWDGVASFRFRKMELRIRNRLYDFTVNLAKRKDLKENAPLLETEMGRILKESLSTEELAIKIREIKAL